MNKWGDVSPNKTNEWFIERNERNYILMYYSGQMLSKKRTVIADWDLCSVKVNIIMTGNTGDNSLIYLLQSRLAYSRNAEGKSLAKWVTEESLRCFKWMSCSDPFRGLWSK